MKDIYMLFGIIKSLLYECLGSMKIYFYRKKFMFFLGDVFRKYDFFWVIYFYIIFIVK